MLWNRQKPRSSCQFTVPIFWICFSQILQFNFDALLMARPPFRVNGPEFESRRRLLWGWRTKLKPYFLLQHVVINNYGVSRYYKRGSRGGVITTLKGSHSIKNLRLSWSFRVWEASLWYISEPALELHSRAAPCVGGITAQLVLTQGGFPEEGRTEKKL